MIVKNTMIKKEKNMENDKSKSMERAFLDPHIAETFKNYFLNWLEETSALSSTQAMFNNKYYQNIINMGWDAVPHIINQLRIKPEHLFKALKTITGVSMIRPGHAGHIYDMAADCIEWYDNYCSIGE
jgi:hypothetical protein